MNRVIAGVVGVLVLALALTGWALYRHIETVSKLKTEMAQLSTALVAANAEVTRRDDLAKLAGTIQVGLDESKEQSREALTTMTRAIRNIKPTPKDTHESINCLRTAVPVGLDGLLRDVAPAK